MDDLVAVDAAAAALDLVLRMQRQLARPRDEVALGLHVGILGERTHPPQDLTSTLSGARGSTGRLSYANREPVDHVQDVHLREREADQGVPPVEEDRRRHAVRVSGWRGS